MWNITCTECNHDFEAEVWEDGTCPNCHADYSWDSIWCEDISEDWIFPVFENVSHKIDKWFAENKPIQTNKMITKNKNIKCHAKDCNQTISVPCHIDKGWCSIECAVYDGYYSVRKGWIKDPKTQNKAVLGVRLSRKTGEESRGWIAHGRRLRSFALPRQKRKQTYVGEQHYDGRVSGISQMYATRKSTELRLQEQSFLLCSGSGSLL